MYLMNPPSLLWYYFKTKKLISKWKTTLKTLLLHFLVPCLDVTSCKCLAKPSSWVVVLFTGAGFLGERLKTLAPSCRKSWGWPGPSKPEININIRKPLREEQKTLPERLYPSYDCVLNISIHSTTVLYLCIYVRSKWICSARQVI